MMRIRQKLSQILPGSIAICVNSFRYRVTAMRRHPKDLTLKGRCFCSICDSVGFTCPPVGVVQMLQRRRYKSSYENDPAIVGCHRLDQGVRGGPNGEGKLGRRDISRLIPALSAGVKKGTTSLKERGTTCRRIVFRHAHQGMVQTQPRRRRVISRPPRPSSASDEGSGTSVTVRRSEIAYTARALAKLPSVKRL